MLPAHLQKQDMAEKARGEDSGRALCLFRLHHNNGADVEKSERLTLMAVGFQSRNLFSCIHVESQRSGLGARQAADNNRRPHSLQVIALMSVLLSANDAGNYLCRTHYPRIKAMALFMKVFISRET